MREKESVHKKRDTRHVKRGRSAAFDSKFHWASVTWSRPLASARALHGGAAAEPYNLFSHWPRSSSRGVPLLLGGTGGVRQSQGGDAVASTIWVCV